MKQILFSMAGLGVGGAAFFGLSDGPDFDRNVERPPMAVYAAFSRLAQEGDVTRRGDPDKEGRVRTITLRTEKVRGESIHYEIILDDRPVITADLGFAPADESGDTTRMTAEIDIDTYDLGSAFETEGGVLLSMVPESYFDNQFARMMDDMAEDVEAGRPLRPLTLGRAGVRRQRASADVDDRRADAARERRAAVRPMMRAEPMVDPEAAAERYRSGR